MSSTFALRPFVAFSSLAALLFTLAVSIVPAQAALLLYDPFTYAGGPGDYIIGSESTGVDVLGGQNPVPSPTAFYAGGWIQSGGDAQSVNSTSLKYPNFPRAGGHVGDAVQFGCCSFGRDGREIAGGLGGTRDPRTIYQSFLVDFGNQGTDDPTQFGRRSIEWWNSGVGDSFLAVELLVTHFEGINDLTLRTTTTSGSSSVPLNGGGLDLDALTGTHLVVMRFEFSPPDDVDPLATSDDDDVVTVFLDPTDSIEANWTPAATVAVNASDLFISHHSASSSFTFSGSGHKAMRFDEMRWGDTFADVTPFGHVPEPSSLVLVWLGAAGLLGLRRRGRTA